jgi:hypothetical protein
VARASDNKSWIGKQKGAILIFGLFISGMALAAIGTWIETEWPFLGKFLIELAMAVLIGGIAAVFLSLPDVVNHLSEVLGQLFTQGKIASLLSPTARDTLMEKLIQERLGQRVECIEQSLFKGLTRMTDDVLKSVHLQNFYVTTDFEPHPKQDTFMCQKSTISFRILTTHLHRDPAIRFQYRYLYGVACSEELASKLTDADFLLAFAAEIDGTDIGAPQIIRRTKDTMCTVSFEFEKDIELTSEDVGVVLKYKAAALKGDYTSISRVRYPTRGFAKTIHTGNEFEYDCTWFTSIGQKIGGPLNGITSELTPGGLTTRKDGWVLPGEGVAIYWSPKRKATA